MIHLDIYHQAKAINIPDELVILHNEKGEVLDTKEIVNCLSYEFSEEELFRCNKTRRRCYDYLKGNYTLEEAKKDRILDGILYLTRLIKEGRINEPEEQL